MVLKRKESPLRIKSEAYSIRISNLYHFLLDTKNEKIVANQIYRSGTSIGANIALKEAGETEYWLNNLFKRGLIEEKGYISMLNDNTELIKMLVTSIKTLKGKQS